MRPFTRPSSSTNTVIALQRMTRGAQSVTAGPREWPGCGQVMADPLGGKLERGQEILLDRLHRVAVRGCRDVDRSHHGRTVPDGSGDRPQAVLELLVDHRPPLIAYSVELRSECFT